MVPGSARALPSRRKVATAATANGAGVWGWDVVPTVRYTRMRHAGLDLELARTERGLCYVGLPTSDHRELERLCARHLPGWQLAHDDEALAPISAQLAQYLDGRRLRFDLAVDLYGTPFQLDVWQVLQAIEPGRTTTYAAVAQAVGRPRAVRAVGQAVGANPVAIVVPCHRVLATGGGLGGYGGGLALKRRLLALEGATVAS
jgi:methylated-DNA-[protein]-cysteine S-methyltransferase